MKSKRFIRLLPVMMVIVIAATFALTGCKKKMPKEEAPPPPPPPKVEEVKPAAPDTTGDAAKKEKEMMDADKARIQVVYFDYDKSDVRPDQRSKITGDAEILRKWSKWSVSVEGHCDERGTAEYNLALGERRAKAVEKALAAEGIDATRVTTISYGKERPADPGHAEDAWSKNRRAEVKIK
jgi:peptidoglycan-associated lipoprotein